jgi:hypothetical protein
VKDVRRMEHLLGGGPDKQAVPTSNPCLNAWLTRLPYMWNLGKSGRPVLFRLAISAHPMERV